MSGDEWGLAIEACPQLAARPGPQYQIVTGTFRHRQSRVLDLQIAGEPALGVTPNHPIWSADRQQFVRCDSLRPGEHLLRADGSLAAVTSVSERAGPQDVFNLETHVTHVYHVATGGILVHNGVLCPARIKRIVGDDDAIILGRNMPDRVRPARDVLNDASGSNRVKSLDNPPSAEDFGYHPETKFTDENGALTPLGKLSVEWNINWLRQQAKDGKRIFDIGRPRNKDLGHWYGAEIKELSKDFHRIRHGRIRITKPDGNTVEATLWEWVAKNG